MKKMVTLKEAAIAAERAYRRGFQQGANNREKFDITQEQCADYRYGKAIEEGWGAPERFADGKIHCPKAMFTIVQRFTMENSNIEAIDI